MNRRELIQSVSARIEAEERKHSERLSDWRIIAATKIVDSTLPDIIKNFCQHLEIVYDSDGDDLANIADEYLKTITGQKPL